MNRDVSRHSAIGAGGFAVVSVILITMLLGAVIGVSYLVIQKNYNDPVRTEQTMDNPHPVQDVNLEIKELGITLPVDSRLAGLSYVSDRVATNDRSLTTVAYMMNPRMHALFEDCDEGYEGGPGPAFAILTKHNGEAPAQANPAQPVRSFDGFWISLSYPENLTCDSDDPTKIAQIGKVKQELQSALADALASSK